MHVISRRNVNDNYPDGLWHLKIDGEMQESRNGPVIVAPGPVVNVYHNPRERVLFDSVRDANPFFHFFEALWMLAGRNDVEYVGNIVKRMYEYSDDGRFLQGAYGYRWRHEFGYDQLNSIINQLQKDPDSRRAVLTMWNPSFDHNGGKDIPCNTHAYISITYRNTEPEVDLTVCCRSNDAIWGCYGANVVHMSFMQEYIACALNMNVGRYTQFSNNFHVYPEMPRFEEVYSSFPNDENNLYALTKEIEPGPELFTGDHLAFYHALCDWLETPHGELTSYPFLSGVAYPMWQALKAYKFKDHAGAQVWADRIDAPDWRYACVNWLTRRSGK
jgi:hypothetical protein